MYLGPGGNSIFSKRSERKNLLQINTWLRQKRRFSKMQKGRRYVVHAFFFEDCKSFWYNFPTSIIAQKNNKESSADELKLRLVGLVKTAVEYSTGQGEEKKVTREDKEILSYDVQLGSFGGKAASGVHNFPFSVTLPEGLPPSMTVRFELFYEATPQPLFVDAVLLWPRTVVAAAVVVFA